MPHLLELTALRSALQLKHAEARDLLEHAEVITQNPADLLRQRLYRAEMLHRAEKNDAARNLLREMLKEARFKDQPAHAAGEVLLKEMGG
ncbi:MAG: hypothetical protein LW645_11295 [Verrucomicrobiaceae bacterium]|nr:hypothetical protein [Verrucomicrobiaceae bacterium]